MKSTITLKTKDNYCLTTVENISIKITNTSKGLALDCFPSSPFESPNYKNYIGSTNIVGIYSNSIKIVTLTASTKSSNNEHYGKVILHSNE